MNDNKFDFHIDHSIELANSVAQEIEDTNNQKIRQSKKERNFNHRTVIITILIGILTLAAGILTLAVTLF